MSSNRTHPSLILPLGRATTVLMLLAFPVAAQQQFIPAASLNGSSKVEDHLAGVKVEPNPQPGASSERLFYALPNFLTVDSRSELQPLTAQEKFKLVARNSFDSFQYPWYAFRAGISQAQNNEPSYGQGMAGYSKRYALTFADCTLENFAVGAIFPSLLHQDPRFYRLGQEPVKHRMAYAVSRIFITRTDSGIEQFNYSEILGSALAAIISAYGYHPAEDHTASHLASSWGTQVGFHTFTIVMREFWPDIRRKLSHAPRRDDLEQIASR